jgi:hypothetical protein
MDARDRSINPVLSQNGSPTVVSPFIRSDRKVLHRKILQASQNTDSLQGGLVTIYQREVISQKTRTVRLLGTKSPTKIIQTLLGYEVQARYKRIHCPDLVTARYIKLFSELGCRSIRLPYDPTVTAQLISLLERAFQSITDTVADLFPGEIKFQRYVTRKIYAILRREILNLT